MREKIFHFVSTITKRSQEDSYWYLTRLVDLDVNEIRNIMVDEKHFPYVLFLQGSNFLTEPVSVSSPDGRVVELRHDVGSMNRIDRLTAANYSMPINENSCKNIFLTSSSLTVMLQAVFHIY